MAVEQIDLVWIAKKMEPDKWYKIKNAKQYAQFLQLVDKRFGFPKFQLSFNNEMTMIKKTLI